MDRGPAREPDGDESRARGRGEIEIACRSDGTILGLRGHTYTDMGAYMRTNGAVGSRNVAQFMSGPYRIPNIDVDVTLFMTNKTPVGTYRGPGRFETDFFRERLFDMVAKDLGIDRVEFRRRNLVAEPEMPYAVATITPFESKDQFDSGDYQITLDRCLAEIGWTEKAKLQGTLIDGRYHGLALGCFIEGGAAGPKESARLVAQRGRLVSRSTWARRRSGRASRRCSRRSRPTRSRCRWIASARCFTARPPM